MSDLRVETKLCLDSIVVGRRYVYPKRVGKAHLSQTCSDGKVGEDKTMHVPQHFLVVQRHRLTSPAAMSGSSSAWQMPALQPSAKAMQRPASTPTVLKALWELDRLGSAEVWLGMGGRSDNSVHECTGRSCGNMVGGMGLDLIPKCIRYRFGSDVLM